MSSYLKYLLLEARSEYILQNKKLIEEIWFVLCREMELELDTPENERVKQVKKFLEDLESHKYIAKYLNWVVKQFINVDWRYPEDIDKLDKNLNKFYRSLAYLKNNNLETDINKYSMSSFNALMNELPETNRQINQEKEKNIKLHQAERYYEDSNWLLLSPRTQEAAILYGKGTQWCTAATESTNYFEHYNSRGPLFILINKKNPKQKYQFHLESGSFMDVTDCEVEPKEIDQIFNSNPALREEIKKIIEDSNEIDLSPTIVIDEDVLKNYLEEVEEKVYLGLSAKTLCQALFNESIDELEDWEIEAEDILSSVDNSMMSALEDYGIKLTNEYKVIEFLFGSAYKESSITPLNDLRKAIIQVLNQTKAGEAFERQRVNALYEDMHEFAKTVINEIFPENKIYYFTDSIEFYLLKNTDFIDNHLCELMIGEDDITSQYLKENPLPDQDFEYYYDVANTSEWDNFINEKLIPAWKEYLNSHPELIEELKTFDIEHPEEGTKEVTNYDPYAYLY